jgi:hypothetical protein
MGRPDTGNRTRLAAFRRSAPPAAEPEDWGSISSVFDALVRHYIELIEFTQRIEAEREQRAFEKAAARYERFEESTHIRFKPLHHTKPQSRREGGSQ